MKVNLTKFHLTLNGLQEILLRKVARKYSNPWIKISITKANKINSYTHWKPGNRYSITIKGDHDCNQIGFMKEVKENGFVNQSSE